MESAPARISTAWHRGNMSPIRSVNGNASTGRPSARIASAVAPCSFSPVCRRNRIPIPSRFARRAIPSTRELIARAPWEPPRASTVKGVPGGNEPCRSPAAATISARTAIPVTSVLAGGKNETAPEKPANTLTAPRARNRFDRPGTLFCSCRNRGTPSSRAAIATGTESYPPTPKTRSGRRRLTTATAATIPRAIRAAPGTARSPRPRTCPEGTKSIESPRAGTARASSPPSVPTKDTEPPGQRERNASASAIPGKTCPPVPPPATIIRIDKAIRPLQGYVHQHADRRQVEDQGTSSIAQEREHHPLRREHLQPHHHVHQRLDADDGGKARGEVLPERIPRAAGDPIAHPYHGNKQGPHQYDPGEAQFLADHGEDVVGVHLRQVEELLPPAADARAEEAAVGEGDQRLHHLVPRGMGLRDRIDEGLQPGHPVRLGRDQDRCPRDPGGGEQRDELPREPGDEDDREERNEDHHGHPEIGLPDYRGDEEPHHREHGKECPVTLPGVLPLPVDDVRRVGEEHELGQLGGLEGEEPQVDPPGGAVRRVPHTRHVHQEQEEEGGREEERDPPPIEVVIDPGKGHRQRHADDQEQNLSLEEVRGVVPVPGGGPRHDVRRAVDHEQSQHREEEGAQREDHVLVAFPDLHPSSSPTAFRNASPRSSKLRNMSKLEQAGEKTTTSPSRAAAAAARTASGSEPATAMGAAPARSRAIRSRASPRRTTARAFRARGTRRGRKSTPLSFPPAISTTGSGNPSSAARTAPTLVPFESFTYVTPRTDRTNSTRWGSPGNAASSASTCSRGTPIARATAIEARAFCTFCSPRIRKDPRGYRSGPFPQRSTMSSPSRNAPSGSRRDEEKGTTRARIPAVREITSGSSALATRTSRSPWFRKIAAFAAAYAGKSTYRSLWSSVMFRRAATAGRNDSTVSSWKLLTSTTPQSNGTPAAATKGVPRFPPTNTRGKARA